MKMKIKKSCISCIHSMQNNFNDDLLCKYKGVVSRNYSCMKYKYNPNSVKTDICEYRCKDCLFLICDPRNNNPNYGYCQLFTVRSFDGSTKPVCSKFVLKQENPGA